MNSRIDERFAELASAGRKALLPYLTCGFPSRKRFIDFAKLLEDRGADGLEIGLPHSDPMADGPTIRHTSHRVLSNGLTMDVAFSLLEQVVEVISIPTIVMCYINTILKPGVERFAARCRAAGVAGAIIPDMTYEERDRVVRCFRDNEIDTIFLTAPTTPAHRVKKIATASSGYLYIVSVTGITGARESLPVTTRTFIRKAKGVSPIPVCVGFGISNEKTARQMGRLADGIIVGSALLDRIVKARSSTRALRDVASLMRQLRKGLDT